MSRESDEKTEKANCISRKLDQFKYQSRSSSSAARIEMTAASSEDSAGEAKPPPPPVKSPESLESDCPNVQKTTLSCHTRNRVVSDSDSGQEGAGAAASASSDVTSRNINHNHNNNNNTSEEVEDPTIDLKSRIRCSYGTISQSQNLLALFNSPKSEQARETSQCPSVISNLSEKIKAAYSSLSSGAKRRRLIINSSDDECEVIATSGPQLNGVDDDDDEDDDDDDSAQRRRRSKRTRISPATVSDATATSDSPVIVEEPPMITNSELVHKEKCLSEICRLYPTLDYMEAQDVLVSHGWSVEIAQDFLRSKKIVNGVVEDSDYESSSCSSSRKQAFACNGTKPGRCRLAPFTKKKGVQFDTDDSDEDFVYKIKKPPNPLSLPTKRKSAKKKKKMSPSETVDCDDLEFSYERHDDVLYDSDDSDVDDTMTPLRAEVLNFYETAKLEELLGVPGCTKKKAECILLLRPFSGWLDLVEKLKSSKGTSTDLLNSAKEMLSSRQVVTKLMQNCEQLSKKMEMQVSRLMNEDHDVDLDDGHLKEQPPSLNTNFRLTHYQLLGVNWLILLHRQKVNGILADEMGLGKTIQALAFLTYLLEEGDEGPHLIVVPASTIDNWVRELNVWSPRLQVLLYQGSPSERKELRWLILTGKESSFNIIITTYSMVVSNAEDRGLFRRVPFNYVVFDEAHLLKNMETQRYQHLMKISAKRRLLLTGTPLQNNLVELMSLLVFVMPNMFEGKRQHLKMVFSIVSKDDREETKGVFEKDRIAHAKQIMKPFVLRRLKHDVLKDLPMKDEVTVRCPMSPEQLDKYKELVADFSHQALENENMFSTSGIGMMMQLRKLANHPLLLRYHYTDDMLRKMSELMLKEPTHHDARSDLILEDMQVMSDFELHKLCGIYKSVASFALKPQHIRNSGKFDYLDDILPEIKTKGDRVLLFSQFVMILDIIEEYMKITGHRYLRLDGSTPVVERLALIDQYSNDGSIFVFLLSTKAGGLGINLTAANTVILHDIDFNPYNDKQAEDRCHRVGQTKTVTVIRLISRDTIEEHILSRAKRKLKLEQDLTSQESDPGEEDAATVASLLKKVLEVPKE